MTVILWVGDIIIRFVLLATWKIVVFHITWSCVLSFISNIFHSGIVIWITRFTLLLIDFCLHQIFSLEGVIDNSKTLRLIIINLINFVDICDCRVSWGCTQVIVVFFRCMSALTIGVLTILVSKSLVQTIVSSRCGIAIIGVFLLIRVW